MIGFMIGLVLGAAFMSRESDPLVVGAFLALLLVAVYFGGRRHAHAEATAIAMAEARSWAEAKAAAWAQASVILHQTFTKGDPAEAEPGRVPSPVLGDGRFQASQQLDSGSERVASTDGPALTINDVEAVLQRLNDAQNGRTSESD